MKCWTTENSRATAGIAVQKDERLGMVVALGEAGRGRTLTLIKLDGRRPPVVENEKISDADIVEFEAGGRKRHALTVATSSTNKILVRVCSGRGYTRRGNGSAYPYWGNPVTVESGYGADGGAGRIGSWGDYLMVVNPNDAIFVQPSGGSDGYVFYYRAVGAEPEIWSAEDFRTEVLGPWAEGCPLESLEARIKTAEERRHTKLAAFLVAKLAERAAMSATETLRRNPRWDAERQAVVVDSVTVFRGREVKSTVVLANAANSDEAAAAAQILAVNLPEAKMLANTIVEAGQKLANAHVTRSLRAPTHWDVQAKVAEKLLGCITAEEARKRDISEITIEQWITAADQARVRESRPESITILGVKKSVKYDFGRASVEFNFTDLTPAQWLAANGTIVLPDNTHVTVKVVGDDWTATTAKGDLAALPERIRAAASEAAFNSWDKPFPGLPMELLEDTTPFTPEAIFGQDILTGDNLIAYGRWDYTGYYGMKIWWERTLEEANTSFDGQLLLEVRKHLKEQEKQRLEHEAREAQQKRVEQARAQAHGVRDELWKLERNRGYDDLGGSLRDEVIDRRYGDLPGTESELLQWAESTRLLIRRVNEALDGVRLQREAEAQAKAAAEQTQTRELACVLEFCQHSTDPLSLARTLRGFAEEIRGLVGTGRAVDALRRELDANYGYGGRKQGLEQSIPRLSKGQYGELFARLSRARDVDAWMEGAKAWLMKGQLNAPLSAPAESLNNSAVTFRETGNRWLKCQGCNIGTIRLDKASYASFQSGQLVSCTCPTCGKSGAASK